MICDKNTKKEINKLTINSSKSLQNTFNDFSHLSIQIKDGINSPLSFRSHKEIFKELKLSILNARVDYEESDI